MSRDPLDQPYPVLAVLAYPVYLGIVLAASILGGAGDWTWPNGWAYATTIALNVGVSTFFINQRNPRVLRNRSRMRRAGVEGEAREEASSDRVIMPLLGLCMIGVVGVAVVDHRSEWSSLSLGVGVAGLVLAHLGVLIMSLSLLQNPFASRILDLNKDQRLVDRGLYGVVRHPFYSGLILWLAGSSIALDSVWGLLPAAALVIVLAIRIHFEEAMLAQGMTGYVDYQSQVRHRIVPGIY